MVLCYESLRKLIQPPYFWPVFWISKSLINNFLSRAYCVPGTLLGPMHTALNKMKFKSCSRVYSLLNTNNMMTPRSLGFQISQSVLVYFHHILQSKEAMLTLLVNVPGLFCYSLGNSRTYLLTSEPIFPYRHITCIITILSSPEDDRPSFFFFSFTLNLGSSNLIQEQLFVMGHFWMKRGKGEFQIATLLVMEVSI